ncbi:MAG: hypothetical protein ABSB75_02825, partial [Candidatus Limnocylindrales bacterium]
MRESHERPSPFGRSDAFRLIVAALLIVVALAAGVAGDLAPSNPGYAAGTVARTAIRAPRDATIPNPVETKAAQDAAAEAEPPHYDYTPERASSIAAVQVAGLQIALKPIDEAFSSTMSPEVRRVVLQTALPTALPSLSPDDRTVLLALDPTRWLVVEGAAESALSAGDQTELRDTDLAAKQTSLALKS